jgi:nitric oxide dioxygenase
MVTAGQSEAIRRSWARAWGRRETLGRRFYARLFERAPETRALFRGDPDLQAEKLTRTLGFVVDRLEDLEALALEARALALRHVGYGARAEHYGAMGEALIGALRDTLGPAAFDDATRDAWAAAYALLCALMLDAAAEAE